MNRNNDSYYADISSFEDLRLERTRLILKSRLLEYKINMNLAGIRETFSFSGAAFSMIKEFIIPRIGDLLGDILKKPEDETGSGSESKTET